MPFTGFANKHGEGTKKKLFRLLFRKITWRALLSNPLYIDKDSYSLTQ
jgi:hypothetical protein